MTRRWPRLQEELVESRQKMLKNIMSLTQKRTFVNQSVQWRTLLEIIIVIGTIISVKFDSARAIVSSEVLSAGGWTLVGETLQKWFFSPFAGKEVTLMQPRLSTAIISFAGFVLRYLVTFAGPVFLWYINSVITSNGLRHLVTLQTLHDKRKMSGYLDSCLINESKDNEGRWATNGPSVKEGISIEHVTAVGEGRVRLRVRIMV